MSSHQTVVTVAGLVLAAALALGGWLIVRSTAARHAAANARSAASLRMAAGVSVPVPLDCRFVRVEPGTFEMGDPATEPDPREVDPAQDNGHHHRVTLTRPFLIAACPVTVAQFTQFVALTGYQTDAERSNQCQGLTAQFKSRSALFSHMNWRTASRGLPVDVPVHCLSALDAEAYCRWAAGVARQPIRLPTEAEWEFACRAGTTGPFNAPGPVTNLGWFADNSGDQPFDADALRRRDWKAYMTHLNAVGCRVHPVGQKRPNAWGLYDMHGNVCQWCSDNFGPYPAGPVTDPTGPTTAADPFWRCARGGCWQAPFTTSTSYDRGYWRARRAHQFIGFRVAADVAG